MRPPKPRRDAESVSQNAELNSSYHAIPYFFNAIFISVTPYRPENLPPFAFKL